MARAPSPACFLGSRPFPFLNHVGAGVPPPSRAKLGSGRQTPAAKAETYFSASCGTTGSRALPEVILIGAFGAFQSPSGFRSFLLGGQPPLSCQSLKFRLSLKSLELGGF